MHPLVSVVIPTFNCGEFIAGACRSALNQTYGNVEVVVVDDCSADDSAGIVRSLGDRVRYFKNDRNLGVSAARNRGIKESTGDYVAFLDADDIWLPTKLVRQIDVLESNKELGAMGGAMVPFESAEPVPSGEGASSCEQFNFSQLAMRNRLATPTVIVRRRVLDQVGTFDEQLSICEDYDLWLRVSRIGPVGRLTTTVARYRSRPNGLSAGNRARTFDLHCDYVRDLPRRFPDIRGIHRMSRIHLAHAALERSIEAVDEAHMLATGAWQLVRSVGHWPFPLPTVSNRWCRLRRLVHTARLALALKAN